MFLPQIDFIKAVGIFFVLLIHSFPDEILRAYLAPFHIWQAVPIFFFVAGITSTLSLEGRGFSLNSFKRIIPPFIVVWLIEMIISFFRNELSPRLALYTILTGGLGPGGYFVYGYIQHLLIFPFLLRIKNRFTDHAPLMIVVFLIGSMILDWLCVLVIRDDRIYRLLYVRYMFAAILGSYFLTHKIPLSLLVPGCILSVVYMLTSTYIGNPPFIYQAWGFQHAPAYFYTLAAVMVLWKIRPVMKPIGRASYHIFLTQMVWFWCVGLLRIPWQYALFPGIVVCLSVGYVFYRTTGGAAVRSGFRSARNEVEPTEPKNEAPRGRS